MEQAPQEGKKLFESYASKTAEEVCQGLATSATQGLSNTEAKTRIKKYGLNQLTQHEETAWHILFKQLKSPFIYLLFIISLVNFVVQNYAEGSMILLLVLINTLFSFYQEYRIHQASLLLKQYIVDKIVVIRNSQSIEIKSSDLVPGDVIKLHAGDKIPADVRLIIVDNLTVDESILTGESAPIEKNSSFVKSQQNILSTATNIGFAGSTIVTGQAVAVIFATGKNTYFGSVATLAAQNPKSTSFLIGLTKFSNFILYLIIFTVFCIFVAHLILSNNFDLMQLIMFSLALGITIIPEALPVVITFSLTRGAEHLAKFKVIVQRLSAIEDLGSMSLLCIDKTGTITENKLSLANIYSDNEQQTLFYSVVVSGLTPEQLEQDQGFDGPVWQQLSYEYKQQFTTYNIIANHPFEPQLRYSSVIVHHDNIDELVIRGNVEELLQLCKNLTDTQKQEIISWSTTEGEQGHRALLIAKKHLDTHTQKITKELESNVEYVGLISFVDPLKSTAKVAIDRARSLGIRIKVISGDTKEVNFAVARQINLINNKNQIITGQEFARLNASEKLKAVEHCSVFAHIAPDQKVEIVRLLENNYDVGYLGDGINDAPALKIAHVSIAVNSATDIARDITDIILLHKSLQAIVDGIYEGRIIFANLIKYIKSMLAANLGHFYSLAIISLLIDFLPLQPAQLLLISLLTDLPLIAIATDSVNFQDIHVPQKYDLKDLILVTIFFGLIIMITDLLVFRIFSSASPQVLQTNWFIASILVELSFFYSIRTKMPFYKANPPSWHLIGLSIVIAILTIALPYTFIGQKFLDFIPPTLQDLGIIFLIVGCYFIVTDMVKIAFYQIYEPRR